MNDNHIDYIIINNFKSVRLAEIRDCRRINLFIGKPNVGKSNILEAFSLFSISYLGYTKNKSLQHFVRAESDSELFFDGYTNNPCYINTSLSSLALESIQDKLYIDPFPNENEGNVYPFEGLTGCEDNTYAQYDNPFKAYFYPSAFEKEKVPLNFLLPPNGGNLMSIVSQLPELKEELKTIFNEYGLQYVFDTNSQEIKVIKKKSSDEIFLIPFNSIADSLKRMIFYKAAIQSNKNSILTFEEPEAHAYPPYISKITQDIIASETNQFFITTHSPYVINDFLEPNNNELAIYLVDFKNGETVVKRLTDEELQQVYDFGIDLFYNTETFL